jgi:hypothetical protein
MKNKTVKVLSAILTILIILVTTACGAKTETEDALNEQEALEQELDKAEETADEQYNAD